MPYSNTTTTIVKEEKDECDHIIGYDEGVYENWLCTKSNGEKVRHDYFGIKFTYCPLCGVRLIEECKKPHE